jgi:hypothetical protein
MSGAVHPLSQYAFMAWCSVKAQGQLYLYLMSVHGIHKVNALWRGRVYPSTRLIAEIIQRILLMKVFDTD